MKFSIIASILVVLLSFSATTSEAAPWRGGYGYGHGHGYCAPRPIVRVYAPRVVIGGGCYGASVGYNTPRNYCAPRYCPPRYCAPHYAARRYYGGGYRNCR